MSSFQHRIDIIGRDRASNALRAVGKTSQSMGRRLADTTATMAHSITIARSMAQAFAAVARPLAIAVKAFASFEKAMSEVSTIADVNEKQFAELSKTVSDFSRKYATDATDTARALYQTISAGNTDVSAATKVMSQSMKFGRAAIVDSSTAVDLMTTVMNSYGMSADQAGQASDILFTTIRMGKTTGEELAGAFGRVTAIAARAGVSLSDLGVATSVLTLGGLKTEEAMTALRQVIVSIAKPTQQSAEAIEKLNLELFNEDVLRERGGLFKIIDELAVASEDSIATLSEVIPNIRALVGALTIAGQEGRITSLLEEFSNAGGATETALEKIMGGFDFRLARTTAEFEALKRATGQSIAENKDFLGGLGFASSALAVMADTITDSRGEFTKMEFGITRMVKDVFPALLESVAYLIETFGGGTGLSTAFHGVTNTFGILADTVRMSANGFAQLTFAIMSMRANLKGAKTEAEAYALQMVDIAEEGAQLRKDLVVKMTSGYLVEENKGLLEFGKNVRSMAQDLRDLGEDMGDAEIMVLPSGAAMDLLKERLAEANEEAADEVGAIWDGFWADYAEGAAAYGQQIGDALGESISNALVDHSQSWNENFSAFGDSAKQTVIDSILDPILGAGGAINDLFTTVLTPLNALGQAINDHLFRPMIDGILKFFGIKKAQEKIAQVESNTSQLAGAVATAATTNAAVGTMLPLLTAAAAASAIASFGGSLTFGPIATAAIAAALASGQGMAAVAQIPAPMAEGGRITSRGIFEVGERGEELILPETRTGRSRDLLRDLYRRRPELAPASGARGGAVITLNISAVGLDEEALASLLADRIDAAIGEAIA